MAGEIRDTDKGWKAFRKAMAEAAGGRHVAVGFVAGGHADDDHDGISVAQLAAIHEFGAPGAGIPERSFLRAAWDSNRQKLEVLTLKLAGEVMAGKMTTDKALGLIGVRFAADVKRFISSGQVKPPLQPATIAAKGSSRPLVDTGQLLNSITFAIRPGVRS